MSFLAPVVLPSEGDPSFLPGRLDAVDGGVEDPFSLDGQVVVLLIPSR